MSLNTEKRSPIVSNYGFYFSKCICGLSLFVETQFKSGMRITFFKDCVVSLYIHYFSLYRLMTWNCVSKLLLCAVQLVSSKFYFNIFFRSASVFVTPSSAAIINPSVSDFGLGDCRKRNVICFDSSFSIIFWKYFPRTDFLGMFV